MFKNLFDLILCLLFRFVGIFKEDTVVGENSNVAMGTLTTAPWLTLRTTPSLYAWTALKAGVPEKSASIFTPRLIYRWALFSESLGIRRFFHDQALGLILSLAVANIKKHFLALLLTWKKVVRNLTIRAVLPGTRCFCSNHYRIAV